MLGPFADLHLYMHLCSSGLNNCLSPKTQTFKYNHSTKQYNISKVTGSGLVIKSLDDLYEIVNSILIPKNNIHNIQNTI